MPNYTFETPTTEITFTLENTGQSVNVITSEVVVLNAVEQGLPGAEVSSLPWDSITDKPNLSESHTFADSTDIDITHAMLKQPGFIVRDSAGSNCYTDDWNYVGSNRIQIRFDVFFTGTVYLH